MKHRHVSVTRRPCGEAGRIMRRDARCLGFNQAEERIANIDGGPWILNQLMNWTVVLSAWCLDFWHLGQHVNQGKDSTFGQTSEAGRHWATKAMHHVKHAGYEPF